MVSKPTDKSACTEADYEPNRMPVESRYSAGSTPALTRDFGSKNDSDLTNGFVPQVRKN